MNNEMSTNDGGIEFLNFNENITPKETAPVVNNTGDDNYIVFQHVNKIYVNGETKVVALNDVSFNIKKGELVVVLGASGAGKSTALNILGGMDTLTSGTVVVDGKNISNYSADELIEYRRNDIGFVFQFYNLVQNLTAKENVELATEICTNPLNPIETLQKVGLGDRVNNFPSQLSGGEQQRTAIARAVAKNPKLLLCDEPTGALDYKIGKQILQLLQNTCRSQNITVVIITHNSALAAIADRVIRFRSGQVTDVTLNTNPMDVEAVEW